MSTSSIQPTISTSRETSNWGVLSLLRFFLAMVVALFHLSFYADVGWAKWLIRLGPLESVLGFLLVSGYSIGHSILRKPEGFLQRRMWRIYPVYLAAMILTYLVHPESLTATFLGIIVINLLFLSQILNKESYLDAGWSLSLEIWLYLLAPFLVRFRHRSLEGLIVLSFIFFSLYTCGRSLFHWPYYVQTLYGINLPALGFIWLTGFYLAVSPSPSKRPLYLLGILFGSYLALAVLIQVVYRLKHREGMLFFSVDAPTYLGNGALFLLLFFIFRGVVRHQFHLNNTWLRVCHFLGDISYPLYLVHFSIFIFFSRYEKNATVLMLGALLTATAVYFGCDSYSRRRPLTKSG